MPIMSTYILAKEFTIEHRFLYTWSRDLRPGMSALWPSVVRTTDKTSSLLSLHESLWSEDSCRTRGNSPQARNLLWACSLLHQHSYFTYIQSIWAKPLCLDDRVKILHQDCNTTVLSPAPCTQMCIVIFCFEHYSGQYKTLGTRMQAEHESHVLYPCYHTWLGIRSCRLPEKAKLATNELDKGYILQEDKTQCTDLDPYMISFHSRLYLSKAQWQTKHRTDHQLLLETPYSSSVSALAFSASWAASWASLAAFSDAFLTSASCLLARHAAFLTSCSAIFCWMKSSELS